MSAAYDADEAVRIGRPLVGGEEPLTTVYCTHCQKTHVVRLDEEQCSPGAWLLAGERWPTDAR